VLFYAVGLLNISFITVITCEGFRCVIMDYPMP